MAGRAARGKWFGRLRGSVCVMWKAYLQLPRSVHVLCLGTLINRAGTLIIPFLTLYLTKHLAFSEDFATLCMGAYGLGGIAAVMIGGHLADTIGRKTVMIASLIGGAASIVALQFVSSGWSVYGCILAFALLMEMYRPAASAMIADLLEPQRRAHGYGLQYIAVNLGFATAAACGGLIAKNWGYHWLFWIDAGSATAFAVIILWALPETLPAATARAGTAAGPAPTELSNAARVNESAIAAFKRIAGHGTFMAFVLASLLISVVYMQGMSTFPLYLATFGIDEEGYGRIVAINGIMIVVLQVPVLGLTQRFDRGWVLSVGAAATALGFALKSCAGTEWGFIGTVAVWTMGEIMAAPYLPAVVSDLAPAHLRARYMGALSMAFSLGNVIGIPVGGIVLHRFGGRVLWLVTCVSALLAACVYFAIRRRIAPVPATIASAAADPSGEPLGQPT